MKPLRSALRTEINITPLIDIVLVLLIVFIVMVPALAHGQRAQASGKGELGAKLELPRISVLGEDRYLCGKEELGGEALVVRISSALATQPIKERKVVLRIPPDMPLRTASEALDLVHLAASRVGEAKDVRAILVSGN